MRRVPLPSEGLYPIRVVACAPRIYGAGDGRARSGFLAVFLAGILLGDERRPYQARDRAVHRRLASLGEIVAFTVLGLSVPLFEPARQRRPA